MPDLGADLFAGLADIVGADHVVTDADLRAPYETDWTGRFVGSTAAVVRPGSTAEVSQVVQWCGRHGVPVVAQGGNTGLVGGGVPLHGEIVLSLIRLDSVGAVDVDARQVTVGAGVLIGGVHAAAEEVGLAYAVDFGARDSATVGGSIATNAGGVNVLRFGGTREQLVGIEAVLGNGAIVSHLGGLIKDNTGYHLASLLCGSEGTLGVITAARLRLVTRHPHRVTALIGLGTVADAVALVTHLRAHLDSLEAAELMLESGIRLVCNTFGIVAPLEPASPVYLLLDVADHHDPTETVAALIDGARGVRGVAVATDESRRAALWRYRHEHTLAINAAGPPHKLDVTLPVHRLAEFVETVPSVVTDLAPHARVWLFGHIGDGNVHVNVTGLDPDDDSVDEAVLRCVSGMRGSISAEHGIGTAKTPWLHLNRSAAEIAAMWSIKRALDPSGILNPHVLLPSDAGSG